MKERIQNAVVNRVVEDFIDISTPLKQFTDAVLQPEGTPSRDQNFADKAKNLTDFSNRAVKTAKIVAAGGSGGNKKLAESLLSSANQVGDTLRDFKQRSSIEFFCYHIRMFFRWKV